MVSLQEAPAVVQSWYNKRIVGCPGGEGGKLLQLVIFFFFLTEIYS